MTTQAGGLVNALAVLGSADGRKFLKRFPGEAGVEGKYAMEHTPHELGFVIASIRAYHVPPRRVLSVGSNTLGAERAIVERIGATAFDWVPTADETTADHAAAHTRNLNALEEAGLVVHERAEGEYDLILVAGNVPVKYEPLLQHARVHGLVVTLGNGLNMQWPHLRALWFRLRNSGHKPLGQTGTGFGEMGVGIVAVTHHPEVPDDAPAVRKERPAPTVPAPAPAPTRKAAPAAPKKPKPKSKPKPVRGKA